jgi:hypothetical protein
MKEVRFEGTVVLREEEHIAWEIHNVPPVDDGEYYLVVLRGPGGNVLASVGGCLMP